MKKGLFLLPLLGGFVLASCEFTIFGKTFKIGGDDNSSQKQSGGSSTPSGKTDDGGSTKPSGGGGTSGSGLATVTMTGLADAVDKNADPLVFAKGGCTVTVSQGSSSSTIASAVAATKTYEFRVYKDFEVECKADTEFSKLEIVYSTYKSGTSTYYFDFDVDGATNEYDNSTGNATLTLNSAAKEFTFSASVHQVRIASITFVA